MHIKRVYIFVLSLLIVGLKTLNAQTDNSGAYIKQDTCLDNILYYHNSKTDYLIYDILGVKYDVFMQHYYNPALIPDDNYYNQLNTSGSAVKNIIFHLSDILDYRRKEDIYSPYIFNKQNIKYFQTPRAYSRLSYSNSLSGGQYFNINFSRNLYKGLNFQTEFSVNYANGEFINSQIMNQFFNASLNYISPGGRYRNNSAFIRNRAYIQENSGIESDSVFINHLYSSPASYPTTLNQGWSKSKNSDFIFFQTYRFENDSNRYSKTFNKGALVHNFSYTHHTDLFDNGDKTITDSVNTNILKNSLFFTNDISAVKSTGFVPVSIGFNYDVLNFTDSLTEKSYYLFSPEIKTSYTYQKFSVTANAVKILLGDDYNGDYQINISSAYRLFKQKQYNIFASFSLQNKEADYIFKHFINQETSWERNLSKTKSLSAVFGFNFKNKFSASFEYSDLKDFHCIDIDNKLFTGNTKLYKINLKNDFLLGKWRLKGSWTLQKAENENILHLPLLAIKQGFSYSFTMFKGKLTSQTGLDANYFSKYTADMYNPQMGMYVLQNNEKIGNYIFADAYLNINIDRFCMYVMLIHPYAGLFGYNYFNSVHYPSEGFTFRYGFSWRLLD